MTIKQSLRAASAIAAAALIAGCGGGGGSAAAVPGAAATAPAAPGGSQGITSGARLTFVIHRTSAHAHGRHSAGAKRAPNYLSNAMLGAQVTATSTGVTPVTRYYDVSNSSPNCTFNNTIDAYQCSIVTPAIASTESLSVLAVDATPDNDNPVTGQGTGFPQSTHVLAVGNAASFSAPLGQITPVSISMNPVAASFGSDCGNEISNQSPSASNIAIDGAGARIVVTATVASSAHMLLVGPNDFDGDCISDSNSLDGGQPFVDVNGSPAPITVQTNTTAVKFVADLSTTNAPAPGATPSGTATFASTLNTDYALLLDFTYNGTIVASSGVGPGQYVVLINNNLTAEPPLFDNGSQGQYASTYLYKIVPVDVYPATISGEDRVTGYDNGSVNGLNVVNSTCAGSWTITPLAVTNGTQPFNVTQVGADSGGACTFALADPITNVVTQTVHELGISP